jgi:uncharacterized protein
VIRAEEFTFAAGTERLAATRILAGRGSAPSIVSLHGLGTTASRARIRYLLMLLAEHGLSSVCFDFSGNGDSTGRLERACLRIRTIESVAAVQQLGHRQPLTIIGTSMGAHLAAAVSAETAARNLILFCPAAYVDQASELCFDDGFSRVKDRLVTGQNRDSSPAFRALATFGGNLLIFAASEDKVIPKELPGHYAAAAPAARSRQVIWLDGCEHLVHPWLETHEVERRSVVQTIVATIAEPTHGAGAPA